MQLSHEEAYERILSEAGVAFLLGGIDTGKSTFATEVVRRGVAAGIHCAVVDADIGQSTIGPPTTVGLKLYPGASPFDGSRRADGLGFVGSLSPRGHMISLVTRTGKLVQRARAAGARLIVVDTTGFVAGIHAQRLKFFKMDLIRPDFVVAFERGGDLDPIVGIAQRFTAARILELPAAPESAARSAEERMSTRERGFASYFEAGVSRWRVKPTVFMPTLPTGFDLALLDQLLVGMEDGKGSCVGIGVLEYDGGEDILRMASPVTEGVRGLLLGSLRIGLDGRSRGPVDLRQLFGTE